MNNRPSDIIRALSGMSRSISTAITESSKELQGTSVDETFRGPLSDQVDALATEFETIISTTKSTIAEIKSVFKVYGLETIKYTESTTLMPNRRYMLETSTVRAFTLPVGQEGDVIAFIGNILNSTASITLLSPELNQVIEGSSFSCHVYWYDGKWRYVANNFDTPVRRSRGSNAKGHYRIGPNMIQMFMRVVPGTTAEWPIAWPDDFRIVKTLVSTQSAKSVSVDGYRLEQARGQYEAMLRPMQQIEVGRADRVNVLKGQKRDIAWVSKTVSDVTMSSGTSLAFINGDGTIAYMQWANISYAFTSIAPVGNLSLDGIGFTTSYVSGNPSLVGISNNINNSDGPMFSTRTLTAPYTLSTKHKEVFSWVHEGRVFLLLTCVTEGLAAGANDRTLLMEVKYGTGAYELIGIAEIPVRFDGNLSFTYKDNTAYVVGYDAYGNQVNALTVRTDGTFYKYSSPLALPDPLALGDCYHLEIDNLDLFVVNALETGTQSNHRAYKALYAQNGDMALAQVTIEANSGTIESLLGSSGYANGVPYVYENVQYVAYSLGLLDLMLVVRPEWTGSGLVLNEEYRSYLKNTGLLTKYSVNERDYVISAPLSMFTTAYDNAAVFELGSRRAEVDVMVTGVRDSMLHNPIIEN